MPIKFPNTVNELKSALKKAIESYSKNPATNNNKLNEAAAAALNYPNYDTLSGAVLKQKPSLQPKQSTFIGTFNVPAKVADYLSEYDEQLDFEYVPLAFDLISAIDDWTFRELDVVYGCRAVVIDDVPAFRSGSLFTDVDTDCNGKTVRINLFGDRTNIGYIKYAFSLVPIDSQELFLAKCYKFIMTIKYNDLVDDDTREKYLSLINVETLSIKSICGWLSCVSPTYQVMLRLWLEDNA